MKKIFVLAPAAENPWYSCRVIEEAALEALAPGGPFEVVMVRDVLAPAMIQRLEVEASAVMVLSTPLLQQVAEQIAKLKSVKLILTVFGDMTGETKLWSRLGVLLERKDVVLLGASTRQCQQIERFASGACIKKRPYSLPRFWTDRAVSEPAQTHRLVYAGRLTPQKNVLELMSCFLRAVEDRPELELHIAGEFHDLGHHFHGLKYDFEQYRQTFGALLDSGKGKIVFHGFLGQDELSQLFDRCATYVSLSTHHDEDFGVSAAQAMSRGLNAILSDWGGHWDYQKLGLAELVAIKVDNRNVPLPSANGAAKLLTVLAAPSYSERIANQEKMRNYLGHQSFRTGLERISGGSAQSYAGQTQLFSDYATASETKYVFNEGLGSLGRELYMAIYDSYLATYSEDRYET